LADTRRREECGVSQYDDIIDLPHHQSPTRPHMPSGGRAAQFSPFAALTGYNEAVEETARLTDRQAELGEDELAALDGRLRWVRRHLEEQPEITVTFFEPDSRKDGGSYAAHTGAVKKIDEAACRLCFADGKQIDIRRIADIRTGCGDVQK